MKYEIVVKVDDRPVLIVESYGGDEKLRALAAADPSSVTFEVYVVNEERVRVGG